MRRGDALKRPCKSPAHWTLGKTRAPVSATSNIQTSVNPDIHAVAANSYSGGNCSRNIVPRVFAPASYYSTKFRDSSITTAGPAWRIPGPVRKNFPSVSTVHNGNLNRRRVARKKKDGEKKIYIRHHTIHPQGTRRGSRPPQPETRHPCRPQGTKIGFFLRSAPWHLLERRDGRCFLFATVYPARLQSQNGGRKILAERRNGRGLGAVVARTRVQNRNALSHDSRWGKRAEGDGMGMCLGCRCANGSAIGLSLGGWGGWDRP